MYEAFFGLTEKPFSLLPDPDFLFFSEKHKRAFALLEYGVQTKGGHCVISGAIGAGKTTLVRHLLDSLDDRTTVGLITNTKRSREDFMQWVLLAFELEYRQAPAATYDEIFMQFLAEQRDAARRTVLIVDEAQNLAVDSFLLLDALVRRSLEVGQYVHLLIVGQPNLTVALQRPRLAQFNKNVAARYELDALDANETYAYLQHRIRVAGGADDLFSDDACQAIFHYSKGIPRIVNLLSDTALVYAYGDGQSKISGALIHAVVAAREQGELLPALQRVQESASQSADLDAPSTHTDGHASAADSDAATQEPSQYEMFQSFLLPDPPAEPAQAVAPEQRPGLAAQPADTATASAGAKKPAFSQATPLGGTRKRSRGPVERTRFRVFYGMVLGVLMFVAVYLWLFSGAPPTKESMQPQQAHSDATQPPIAPQRIPVPQQYLPINVDPPSPAAGNNVVPNVAPPQVDIESTVGVVTQQPSAVAVVPAAEPVESLSTSAAGFQMHELTEYKQATGHANTDSAPAVPTSPDGETDWQVLAEPLDSAVASEVPEVPSPQPAAKAVVEAVQPAPQVVPKPAAPKPAANEVAESKRNQQKQAEQARERELAQQRARKQRAQRLRQERRTRERLEAERLERERLERERIAQAEAERRAREEFNAQVAEVEQAMQTARRIKQEELRKKLAAEQRLPVVEEPKGIDASQWQRGTVEVNKPAFVADPCKGPAARFLSTCKDR